MEGSLDCEVLRLPLYSDQAMELMSWFELHCREHWVFLDGCFCAGSLPDGQVCLRGPNVCSGMRVMQVHCAHILEKSEKAPVLKVGDLFASWLKGTGIRHLKDCCITSKSTIHLSEEDRADESCIRELQDCLLHGTPVKDKRLAGQPYDPLTAEAVKVCIDDCVRDMKEAHETGMKDPAWTYGKACIMYKNIRYKYVDKIFSLTGRTVNYFWKMYDKHPFWREMLLKD